MIRYKLMFAVALLFLSFHLVAESMSKEGFLEKYRIEKTDVVKSLDSNYCYTYQSDFFSQVSISSTGENIFDSIESCIAAGGQLDPYLKARLMTESPETFFELLKKEENAKSENDKFIAKDKADTKFYGINWGLGFAHTNVGTDRIIDVTIESNGENVPGTISVNKSQSTNTIAMLETHYFLGENYESENRWFGHGPFLAIGVAGKDNVDPLSTFGIGWMIGLKQKDGSSFNVGLGYFVDSSVQQLRAGVEDRSTTELTDPSKLLVEKDEEGYMLMFSFAF